MKLEEKPETPNAGQCESPMKSRDTSPPKNVDPASTILAELDIHALKFACKSSWKTARTFWTVSLLFGGIICFSCVYSLVNSYRNHPTVTKISTVHQPHYDYPVFTLCTRHNWNVKKAVEEGLSRDAQLYALTLIRNPSHYKGLTNTYNITVGRPEFYEFAKKKNFSTYAQFFEWISFGSSDVIVAEKGLTTLDFKTNLVAGPFYDGYAMSYRICYLIDAQPYDPLVGTVLEIVYDIPPQDEQFGSKSDVAFMSDLSALALEKDAVQIRANRWVTVRFSTTAYSRIPDDECYSKQQLADLGGNYHKDYCIHMCYVEAIQTCTNCTVLTNVTRILGPDASLQVCNWIDNEVQPHDCSAEITDVLAECFRRCKPPCDLSRIDYSTTQALVDVELENSTKSVLTLYFRADDGLLLYEELNMFTFDTLISAIGSDLGLWLGASVTVLFEFIFALAQTLGLIRRLPKHPAVVRSVRSIRHAVSTRLITLRRRRSSDRRYNL